MPPLRLFLLLLLLSSDLAGAEEMGRLEQIELHGYLTVLTRNANTTYYEGAAGPAGVEYELAQGFADYLGVELRLVVAANVADVLTRLRNGEADLAAAALSITPERKRWFRFTPPYQEIRQRLVYRKGSRRPQTLADLDGRLEVTADSSHAETLWMLSDMYPRLDWGTRPADSEDLLTSVWNREIAYTIVDSNEFQLNQRYYPEVTIAFDIELPEALAWALPKSGDDTLYLAASAYLDQLRASGALAQLLERYYGHLNDFDYVGTRLFLRHIDERLPTYRPHFRQAGAAHGIDWRLLAAMAYQESHWDNNAVSPTGVRGLMMVTQDTAARLGLTDRRDPQQSIDGGARYLQQLIQTLPEHIPHPDRLWLALAAYNLGYGHLEDACLLTARRGGDPDSWKDVKATLPLLRRKKWHSTVKHGYARGDEALLYVENIRSYFEVLVRLDGQEIGQARSTANIAASGVE